MESTHLTGDGNKFEHGRANAATQSLATCCQFEAEALLSQERA